MMCYRVGKGRKSLFREMPVKWTHGEIAVISVPNSELSPEGGKGEELM